MHHDAANRLIAAGRPDEAISMLKMAGQRGDAAAWFRLAILYLVGSHVPRDLPAARNALALARKGGHPDAVLTEAALTANGTGGDSDWQRAVALLREAATRHQIAREHLALLDSMDLDSEGNPKRLPDVRSLSDVPKVALAKGFISPAEARHVVQAAADLLEPATVVDPRTGRLIAHPIRTSRNAAIGPTRESLPIQAILRRIARITGTNVTQGEPLTLLEYRPGQEYRPHLDALPGQANQRTTTVLLYLNHGYQGGETRFLKNGLTVAGRGGDALIFDNVLADGRPDPDAEHAGLPVTAGQKLLATRWIRAQPVDPWTMGGA